MKFLMGCLTGLVTMAVVVVLAAAYFLGNVPIVSGLMGTNKPVDLGVKVSVDAAYQALKNLKRPATIQELEAIVKNPQLFKSFKATLSEEQVSSFLGLGDIPDFPLRLTQFKFHQDGTVETSGLLDTALAQTFLLKNGVPNDLINQGVNYFNLAGKVTYYAKGAIKIENNKVNLNIASARIGNIPVPDVVTKETAAIGDWVSKTLTKNEYNVRKLTVSAGKVELDADRPLSALRPWLRYVQR